MTIFNKGDLIDDRYKVLSILGEGGMGVVYKVDDNILSAEVALKTLLPDFVQSKEALTRFINEAKVLIKLTHDNIIRVYDIRPLNDFYYMTMQYIEGFSLYDYLKKNPERDIGYMLSIIKKICAGLAYAHRLGTHHRDIKPANIMMTNQGGIYLVDFGLAKLADGVGNITRLGGAGTPNYMAPEQKKGGNIDHRADVYSIGTMSFEMFTGELPQFVDASASELNPKLDPSVDEVLVKALAINLSKRYGNITEFIQDLEVAITTKKTAPEIPLETEEEDLDVTGQITVLDRPEKIAVSPDSIKNMVMIPAGRVWMGSSPNESKNESEKPRHRVNLSTYYIDKYPVTNQAYRSFIKATGHPEPPYWSDPQFSDPMQPVVGVSWYDAMKYAEWERKRLPTEAEWEKAAKGEDNLIYPWGNEPSTGMANIDYAVGQISRVDQFAGGVSPFGCFDMIGNIWEWCLDWYDEKYYAASPVENPQGPEMGEKKVIKGGAWDTMIYNTRNAFRFFAAPDTKDPKTGFRCALSE